jgi:hypothetical protein
MSASELLTLKQAAALLGLPPAQLKRWFLQGAGPKVAQGSPYALDGLKYAKTALDDWKRKLPAHG